jgi:hypothetical protein
VILPKDVMSVVTKLAKLQGRSRSAVARDFLVEVAPVLARVANTLEAAATMDAAGRAKLVRNLEAAQDALEGQAELALDHFKRGTRTPGRAHNRRASRGVSRPRRPGPPS